MKEIRLQAVDLRDEIAKYERENRPFPPGSGSVSKPKPSTEPETDWVHVKFAFAGEGKPVFWKIITQVHDAA